MKPYRVAFLAPDDVTRYDALYASGTRASHSWALQQPVLADWIARAWQGRRSVEALDFASGTGRVLRFVSPLVTRVDGLDISPAMAARAREVAPTDRVLVGDLLTDDPTDDHYDLATMFRFLLNTEQDVRADVLERLRSKLAARRGWLIFNNHGHAASCHRLAVRRHRRDERPTVALGEREVRRLLDRSGFVLVDRYGVQLLPACLWRWRGQPIARAVDRWAAGRAPLGRVSSDVMYLARARR